MFERPIGRNQGVAFPIADSYIEIEAANLMRFRAASLFDAAQPLRGAGQHGQAACREGVVGGRQRVHADVLGGFGFACEYDVERKFRETRLYQVAPISTNLIYSYIAEHVLGMPRSF